MSNLDVFATALRALTDTPSPTVRIDLNAVTFLAAAGVRTLIRDTAPTATAERTSRSTPPRTSPASSNCSTSTDSPNSPQLPRCARTRGDDRRDRSGRQAGSHRRAGQRAPDPIRLGSVGPAAHLQSRQPLSIGRGCGSPGELVTDPYIARTTARGSCCGRRSGLPSPSPLAAVTGRRRCKRIGTFNTRTRCVSGRPGLDHV